MSEGNVTVTVPPALRRELDACAACRRPVMEGACMGVEAALRDHFQELQGRPRRDGLQPLGFWSGTDGNSVAEKIGGHVVRGDGSAAVLIDSPELRHKLDGGTVKASDYGHTYLTIPATNAAAKAPQGARSFVTHIERVPHPDGGVRPALVAGESKAEDGGTASSALYWLVRKVAHKAMPDALPPQESLDTAAREAALDALDALMKGAA